MAQLKVKCSIDNGGQTVTLPGQNVAYRIRANNIFLIVGEYVPYVVAADATFDGTSTKFTLAGAYQGQGGAGLDCAVATDFTVPDNLPTLSQGDVGTAAIFTKAMYQIQDMIKEVSPDGFAASIREIHASLNGAQQAQAAAAGSAGAASDSAANAAASATAAAGSSTSAGASKSAASTSAANAKTSETNAAASAAAAANSATSSTNSASNSASSASASAASSISAANSATNAASSATAAAASATNAKTSEANAKTSETNAKASETNAKVSETNAASSKTAAATSATNAATSATAAAGSATAAAGSASAASASASSASSVLTQVQGILTTMNALYLGKQSADPAKDNNGNPLVVGCEYFNTTTNQMRVYTSTGWQDQDATAETMAANATASASQAAGSATAADNSAAAAASSASSASSSKAAAATSATNAANSASAAAASQTSAATSATNAANSATAAANSAAQAQTAVSGYAKLDGSSPFTGPVSVNSAPTATSAQLSVKGASGANGVEGKMRFWGTFGGTNTDTGSRLIASLRAGFDGGAWGKEYLDFLVNKSANDSQSDANQARAMRLTFGGRVLVGDTSDDGYSGLQVAGSGTFGGGVTSSGLDRGGANFRLMNGKDVLLRNDGSNFYFLLSNGSGTGASWNNYRPLTINVATGVVSIDDTGVGTYVGGQLNVKGMLNVGNGPAEGRAIFGPSGGYYFGSATQAGFYLPSSGAMFAFDFAKKNLVIGSGSEVWHAGNLPSPAQTTGITMSGQFLAAEGSVGTPGIAFANDGAPDTGFFHVADGVFAVTNNSRETMRFVAVDGNYQNNRVLIGTTVDDGSLLQVGGNAVTRGLHRFGSGVTTAWVNSDAAWGYFRSNGNVSVGSEGATGSLQLLAGKAEAARLYPGGRMTIGGIADDGTTTLQSKGAIKAIGSVGAFVATNGGGSTQTSMILRRDGGATDQKSWEILHGGDGTFAIRTANDAYSSAQNALWITRGSGAAVGNMVLMQTGGRVLVGTASDDGANLLQVAGTGMFSNAVSAYSSTNDTQVTLSTSNYSGGATLEAFNKANTSKKNIALAPWGGRVLIGSAADDATSLLQVGGKARFMGDVRTSDSNGFRVVYGNYGAFLRNDGSDVYLLQTASGDQSGLWNSYRPFAWNLSSGYVSIDSTGSGASFGGNVGISGALTVSKDARVATTGGNLMVGGIAYASGTNATIAPDGNVWGTQWGSQWLRTFLDTTFVHKAGDTLTSDLRVRAPNSSTAVGAVFARPDNTALAWLHGSMSTGGAYGYSSWATMNTDGTWRANVITVNGTDNSATIMNLRANGVTYFGDRIVVARDGMQADIGLRNNRSGQDSWTYLRARDGGGLEVINSAYNGVPWNVSNDGQTWQNGSLHVGGSTLQTDGNLWQGYRSRWLSDDMGKLDDAWNKANDAQVNRADRGAQCQIVALEEVGPYDMTQGTQFWIRRDNPWVMNGIGFAAGNRCWVRFAWLRNN